MGSGLYYVQVKCVFHPEGFNPRAFNLTASVSLNDPESLEEMGLLITSRSVERFHLTEEGPRRLGLVLIKEKTYPETTDGVTYDVQAADDFLVQKPDPDHLKQFIRPPPAIVTQPLTGKTIPRRLDSGRPGSYEG